MHVNCLYVYLSKLRPGEFGLVDPVLTSHWQER